MNWKPACCVGLPLLACFLLFVFVDPEQHGAGRWLGVTLATGCCLVSVSLVGFDFFLVRTAEKQIPPEVRIVSLCLVVLTIGAFFFWAEVERLRTQAPQWMLEENQRKIDQSGN